MILKIEYIMVNFLKQIYGTKYSDTEYKTIAWSGLCDTKAWNLLPTNEKQPYIDTWYQQYWNWTTPAGASILLVPINNKIINSKKKCDIFISFATVIYWTRARCSRQQGATAMEKVLDQIKSKGNEKK